MSDRYDLARRDAPEMPGDTCPHIDPVIENVETSIRRIRKAVLEIEGAADDLGDVDSEMEKLRGMNSDLRECAYFWKGKAEEFDEVIDQREARIAELEELIQQVRDEVDRNDPSWIEEFIRRAA